MNFSSEKIKRLMTAVTDLKEHQHFKQRPLVRKEMCSDERPLLKTLIFFEISYGSYQLFTLFITVYAVFYSFLVDFGSVGLS